MNSETRRRTREALADYRRGVETGLMSNASPNVVRELLNEIDRLRGVCVTAAQDLHAVTARDDRLIRGMALGDVEHVRLTLLAEKSEVHDG